MGAINLQILIFYKVPVDDLKPVFNVLSSAVLVVTMVSMFPKIQDEQRRDAKRVRFEGDKAPKSVGEKRSDEKHPSKLQLSSALCQSLVAQCSMMPTKADSILSQAFASATGSLKE